MVIKPLSCFSAIAINGTLFERNKYVNFVCLTMVLIAVKLLVPFTQSIIERPCDRQLLKFGSIFNQLTSIDLTHIPVNGIQIRIKINEFNRILQIKTSILYLNKAKTNY